MKVFEIVLLFVVFVSCQESREEKTSASSPSVESDITLTKKTKVEETKILFKNSNKDLQKFQNIEMRLALSDIDELILGYCIDNKKTPSIKYLKEHVSPMAEPHTDFKGVKQISYDDIQIKSLDLEYNKEDFECQGSISVNISKIPWEGTVLIPQNIDKFDFTKQGRSI